MDLHLLQILPSLLPTEPRRSPGPGEISHNVRRDQFVALPFDIMYMIFGYFDGQDVLSLIQAS
jgi:hypothetical protein